MQAGRSSRQDGAVEIMVNQGAYKAEGIHFYCSDISNLSKVHHIYIPRSTEYCVNLTLKKKKSYPLVEHQLINQKVT